MMKIVINEKDFRECCNKARDIYLNNLKKAAEEKGEEMPKLVEVGETVSMIIFADELRKVIFNSDDESQDTKDDSITVKLDIPNCFIDHYNRDKFKESLSKIKHDITDSNVRNGFYPNLSGIYEIETLDMLIHALYNSKIVR